MAKAAQAQELRAAFLEHREQTQGHVERLDQVFELIDKPARGKTCDAINGIISEGSEIMEDFKDTEALDPGLLAAAQAVEHYEISRYGTLKTWAGQLGLTKVVPLLEATLLEEKKTDDLLSKIALQAVNRKSCGLKQLGDIADRDVASKWLSESKLSIKQASRKRSPSALSRAASASAHCAPALRPVFRYTRE